MKTRTNRSFHEHIVAIGVAIVLLAAISLGVNQSGLLSADILQGQSKVAVVEGDIGYTIKDNTIVITSKKSFNDATSLTFMVVYDPETIVVPVKESITNYDYTSSSGKKGVTNMTVFFTKPISAGETIITVPFQGTTTDVNVSDASMQFQGGSVDKLAIAKQ